ncbi:MAG: nucleotide-binding protein [Treponema sp.]
MQIIPIASGKGGVGKSLLSANLAIALGQAGKNVLIVDLDLGASNLHLVLGQQANTHSIGTFLSGNSKFEDIIVNTNYNNVRFIPGDSEIPGFAALKAADKNNLTRNLLKANADYLILDLGAGTHLGILDFFLLSPQGIIVTAPSVTATLNAYLFLKNIVFRMLYSAFRRKTPGFAYLEKLKTDTSSMQRMYIPHMITELKKVDPEHTEIFLRDLQLFKPRLIMNMLDDPKDADKALKIRRSCKEYLNINLEHLGVIYRDSIQDTALASRLPAIIYKPQAMVSQAIYRISDKILQSETESFATQTEYEDYMEESFYAAGEEAEADFRSKLDYVKELMNSDVLTMHDLAEMIKSQQYEISALKRENNLLRRKVSKAIEQGCRV